MFDSNEFKRLGLYPQPISYMKLGRVILGCVFANPNFVKILHGGDKNIL